MKKPLVPPRPSCDAPDPDKMDFSSLSFQNRTPAMEKYLKKYDPKAPENVKQRRRKRLIAFCHWWSENWLAVIGLLVSTVAAVFSVLAYFK